MESSKSRVPTMKPLIKGERIIRIGVAIAGILLLPLAAFAYQASSISSSQLLNPDELVKVLQSSAGEKPLSSRLGRTCFMRRRIFPVPSTSVRLPAKVVCNSCASVLGLCPGTSSSLFIVVVAPGTTARTSSLPTMHCARWVSRTSRCSTSRTISARTGWTRAIPLPRETEIWLLS